jgi:two-component system sensor histidine kinase PilS (NtrC family)
MTGVPETRSRPITTQVSPITAEAPSASTELGRRLVWLMVLRTFAISVALGLNLWMLSAADQPSGGLVLLLSAIIAATYSVTIVGALLLRRGTAAERLVWPQLIVDLTITTLLVATTGGAESGYGLFYSLTVIAAAALQYRRGVLIVTVAALGLLTLVSVLAWTRNLPLPMVPQARPWDLTSLGFAKELGQNVLSVITIAVLAFVFADQLQKTTQSLATERRTVADLFTLHQDIVRSLSSGLITIDPHSRVISANQAASEILGVATEAVEGRPIEQVLPGIQAQLRPLGPADALRRGDLACSLDGKQRFLGVSVSPLRDVHEALVGRVINFQDLTELRQLEQSMRSAEHMATLGKLAAGIAHEIRNPLASISGSVELLRQSPQTSDDDRALMAIVTREIDRLNSLITDLLDYVNPRPRHLVEFDLVILVRETLEVFRNDPSFAKIRLDLDSDGPADIRLDADPEQIRQVLWNLLRNAADAAAQGGSMVTVTVRKQEGGGALFAISDDGPGIAREHLPQVFEPFFTTKRRGTGLGLATCHSIVTRHGGFIDIDSQVGVGTRVTVILQRTPPPTAAMSRPGGMVIPS